MEILLTLAYLSFFIFLIGKMKFFQVEGISVRFVQAGFLIKVAAGIMVGLVYTYYYTDRLTADTFKFFDDSQVLFNTAYSNTEDFFRMFTGLGGDAAHLEPYYNKMNNWYDIYSPFNDNRTMIRFNALVRFFSLGHYFVHVVFICFFSLMGIIATVKVFKQEYPKLAMEFYLILLLLPSVLFWGSGLLKDALVYFSFGMVLLTFNNLIRAKLFKTLNLFYLMIAMWFLLFTKFQVFIIMIPLLFAWWIIFRFNVKPFPTFGIISFIYFGMLFTPFATAAGGIELTALLASKQQAFFELAQTARAGSFITIPVLEPNALSILMNAPMGFINALTRPFITDTGPVLTLISSIENTLLLLFGLYSLLKFNKNSLKGKILPWFCFFYTLTYFTLIGMITPILGAMVRYKAQALPFLVIMFVIISYNEKEGLIRKLLSRLKIQS